MASRAAAVDLEAYACSVADGVHGGCLQISELLFGSAHHLPLQALQFLPVAAHQPANPLLDLSCEVAKGALELTGIHAGLSLMKRG